MRKICTGVFMLFIVVVSGCGTIIPGPRYRVTVDDLAFNYDGSAVVYLEEDFRFYPFLLYYRNKRELYLYDRTTRKHAFLGLTDDFSVSPYGPFVLFSPARSGRGRDDPTPDFYIFDQVTGDRKGFFMAPGFDRGYTTCGIPFVTWDKDGGGCTAFVRFYYNDKSGDRVRHRFWRRHGTKPGRWHTERWKVRIEPDRREVADASPYDESIPRIPWAEARARKFTSPDESEELVIDKYKGYFDFNSEVRIINGESDRDEYVVKENLLFGLAQAGKYTAQYIFLVPFLWINESVTEWQQRDGEDGR
jgi:hypothetical protein